MMQRFEAVEAASADVPWAVASKCGLIPETEVSATPRAEQRAAVALACTGAQAQALVRSQGCAE